MGSAFAEGCINNRELAEPGRDAQVKNLVISYVTEQMDMPGVRERIVRGMSSIYPAIYSSAGFDGGADGLSESTETRLTRATCSQMVSA
jgi:hypothetical protein